MKRFFKFIPILLLLCFSTVFAENYVHYEWTCVQKDGSNVAQSDTITENKTYTTAKFYSNGGNGLPTNCIGTQTKNTYTVTLNGNGGTVSGGLSYQSDGSFKLPTNVTKTGYTFTGWTGSNGTTAQTDVTVSATTSGNLTYTANWEIIGPTITFNADNGTFNDGSTNNKIIYGEATTGTVTKSSHTDSYSDDGTQIGWYRDYETKTEVVTIEGATELAITVNYNTEGAYSDWISIFSGSHPEYTAYDNYSSADIVKRLGGGYGSIKTANYTVEGDSVTFAWRTDGGIGGFSGYYATVVGETVIYPIVSGSYEQPTPTNPKQRFRGWTTTKGSTTIEYKADGSDIPKNQELILYAVYSDTTWMEDWVYELTDDYIWLHAYIGSETTYTVPSSATIDGKTYTTKIGSWTKTQQPKLRTGTITNLGFEKGVVLNSDLNSLFYGCSKLASLDVTNFDTNNVIDMSKMFIGCQNLTTLDLSNFNTSKVTTMKQMFDGCESLTTLDLSKFNTSKVTTMGQMFDGCESLTTLDLSSFNTSNVTDMYGMFIWCWRLESLNLSNFDTSKVTKISLMFYYCESLTTLDLSSFNTSEVTDMQYMFHNCKKLKTIEFGEYFDTSNVTNMFSMFRGCENLTTLDLSGFDTSKVTNMGQMFYSCENLTTIYVSSSFTTNKVTSSSYMFNTCRNLVGGNGTEYNKNYIDKTYARIDASSTPGYFTKK